MSVGLGAMALNGDGTDWGEYTAYASSFKGTYGNEPMDCFGRTLVSSNGENMESTTTHLAIGDSLIVAMMLGSLFAGGTTLGRRRRNNR